MSKYNSRGLHSKIIIPTYKPDLSNIRSIPVKKLNLNTSTESNHRFQSPNRIPTGNTEQFDSKIIELQREIHCPEDGNTLKFIGVSLNTDHIGRFSKDILISPQGFRTPPKLPSKYKMRGLLAKNTSKVNEQKFPTIPETISPLRNGVRQPNKKIAYYNLLRTKEIRAYKTLKSKKSKVQMNSPNEMKLPSFPLYQSLFPASLIHKTQASPDGNIFYYRSFNFSSNSRVTLKTAFKSSNRFSFEFIGDKQSRQTLYHSYSKILLREDKDAKLIERNLDLEGQRFKTMSNPRRSCIDKESRESPIEQP